MGKVFPFRAWRYSERAGKKETLVTQPYDKITAELQESYYRSNPYNIVRLIKRKNTPDSILTSNIYEEAAETLETWIARGILEQDDQPNLYAYFQEFRNPDGDNVITRKGFISLLQLEEYSTGVVHRHELTHSGPKRDRLELTRHTQTHFGQLLMLYEDPKTTIDQLLDRKTVGPPLIDVKDDFGATHKVWGISDSKDIAQIQSSMFDKKLMIADGHHRYETALSYAQENPNVPGADRVMVTLVNMHAPGLVVLATHRVLNALPTFDKTDFLVQLSEHFELKSFENYEMFIRHMSETPSEKLTIGAVFLGDPLHYLLTARRTGENSQVRFSNTENPLDVSILHSLVIEDLLKISPSDVKELKHIRYIRGLQEAIQEVRSCRAQVAFLLRPAKAEKVAEVAFSGGVMPQKSTDFYPKLQTGLTMYRFGFGKH